MPDPPARQGRHIDRRQPAVRHSHHRLPVPGRRVPRPRRGGRGSASPLHRFAGVSSAAYGNGTTARHPRRVGVRRCLTRRPARAGKPSVPSRRCAVPITACRCLPIVCRAPGAAGEAAPRPYNVGNTIPGRTHGITGTRDPRPVGVRRCLTRRPARAGRPDQPRPTPSRVAGRFPRRHRHRFPRRRRAGTTASPDWRPLGPTCNRPTPSRVLPIGDRVGAGRARPCARTPRRLGRRYDRTRSPLDAVHPIGYTGYGHGRQRERVDGRPGALL